MWEYTSPTDPDRVSPVLVSNEEVWSWLNMVLKVGNQQVVGGSEAFDKRHLLNLVSPPLSPPSSGSSGALLSPDFGLFFQGFGHPESRPHLRKGAEGAAKEASQVEASRARKKKKAEKAEWQTKKEMEVACRVRMGEDRDAI
jgi:hypothetical protein